MDQRAGDEKKYHATCELNLPHVFFERIAPESLLSAASRYNRLPQGLTNGRDLVVREVKHAIGRLELVNHS
jgi:hypothetical protein